MLFAPSVLCNVCFFVKSCAASSSTCKYALRRLWIWWQGPCICKGSLARGEDREGKPFTAFTAVFRTEPAKPAKPAKPQPICCTVRSGPLKAQTRPTVPCKMQPVGVGRTGQIFWSGIRNRGARSNNGNTVWNGCHFLIVLRASGKGTEIQGDGSIWSGHRPSKMFRYSHERTGSARIAYCEVERAWPRDVDWPLSFMWWIWSSPSLSQSGFTKEKDSRLPGGQHCLWCWSGSCSTDSAWFYHIHPELFSFNGFNMVQCKTIENVA